MALPASRVVGHKEYGNTYSPGRKTDPTYSMNWRRQRVADFKPHNTAPEPEDDMAAVPQKEWDELRRLVTELHTSYREGIVGRRHDGSALKRILLARGVADVDESAIVSELRPVLLEVAQAAQQSPGVSADEIVDRIAERLAE